MQTSETVDLPDSASFVDYQTRIVRLCKQQAGTTQDIVAKASNPQSVCELGPLANQLTQQYSQLCLESQGAVGTQPNDEIAGRIQACVQALGQASIHLVRDAGAVQLAPEDTMVRIQLGDHARNVQERIADLLTALQVKRPCAFSLADFETLVEWSLFLKDWPLQ